MLRRRGQPVDSGASGASALDQLLSVEQEVATQTAAAAGEAESLVAGARADADAIRLNGEAALAAELAQAESNAAAARTALVRTLEAEGERLVVRYQTLTDSEISSMAAFVIHEATGLTPAEAR